MTLTELFNQCRQIETQLTSCEIPLKYCGKDVTIKLELNGEDMNVDVKIYVDDKEIQLYNFPICC